MGWGTDSLGGSAGDFEGTSFGGDSAGSASSSTSSDRGGNDGGDSQSAAAASFDYGFGGGSAPSQEEAAASFDYGFGGGQAAPAPRGSVSDPFAGTIGIAAPKTLPSGVVDYTSPNLLTSLISPRSMTPQQAISKMGIEGISPYRPDYVTFPDGSRSMTVDPLAGVSPIVFNMGRTQQQVDDRSFFDRLAEGVGDRLGFTYQNQRAGLYDPMFDRFNQVTQDRVVDGRTYLGSSRLDKTSDNPITDLIANALAAPFGSTVDTATFVPATGGEQYLYQSGGGLLGMLQDPLLRPRSEVEAEAAARQAQMGGDGSDQPLIIPQEVAEIDPETGEPTQFPDFTPREYKYQPYTAKFYSIPSRFTQPYGLLG